MTSLQIDKLTAPRCSRWSSAAQAGGCAIQLLSFSALFGVFLPWQIASQSLRAKQQHPLHQDGAEINSSIVYETLSRQKSTNSIRC